MPYVFTARRLVEPMLACKKPKNYTREQFINELMFHHPVLLSQPKIDGIRCIVVGGRPLSRTFKLIPNLWVRKMFEEAKLVDGLDGELITFTNGKRDDFNTVQSKIMSQDGMPDFTFIIFDFAMKGYLDAPFERRHSLITNQPLAKWCTTLHCNMHIIESTDHLVNVEKLYIEEQQWEGIMLRTPSARYKCGRATLNEGYLTAIKTFEDSEALVVGYFEQMHNDNALDSDNFGRTKRSKSKEGMSPSGMLGGFVVQDVKTGVEFEVSTGLTKLERVRLWLEREKTIGLTMTYQFQSYGKKDKPRCPSFKGWRKDLV